MKAKNTLYLIILLLLIVGCNNDENNGREIKTLDRAPNPLEDAYKEIGSVLEGAGRIERISLGIDFSGEEEKTAQEKKDPIPEEEEEESKKPPQNLESGENGEGEIESQETDIKESNDKDENPSEANMSENLKETWREMDKSLETIYIAWSDYESDGIKKGASKDRLIEFKDSLNKLTKSVENRNIVDIYETASLSLLNLKPFFDLYKDDYRGEICALEHSIFQYYIKAVTGDKEGASSAVEGNEESINKIRLLIGDDEKKEEMLDKISTQLESLGISLDDASQRVHILEKDTLVRNLEALK